MISKKYTNIKRVFCSAGLGTVVLKSVCRCQSSDPSTIDFRGKYVLVWKWGILSLITTSFVSFALVWWEIVSLRRHLSTISMGKVTGHHLNPYIYLWQQSPPDPDLDQNDSNGPKSEEERQQSDNKKTDIWFPWLQSKSTDPWVLLQLCKSDVKEVRELGIRVLAGKAGWEDYKYRYVAQAADARTLIGLARTQASDARFFLPQPDLPTPQMTLLEELAKLLIALEKSRNSSSNSNAKLSTSSIVSKVLQLYHNHQTTSDHTKQFWDFNESSLEIPVIDHDNPALADNVLELHFMNALAELTANLSELSVLLVQTGGLAVLQRAIQVRNDVGMQMAVASVLGNLAMYQDTHEAIVRSGWLGVLKSWSKCVNTPLALLSARVLANLDRDWTSDVLADSVLLLHPTFRTTKTFHADIVFVHGLLGGAVKTWRQDNKKDKSCSECWPKDWLAEDCPHSRIFSVHYDSSLSTWGGTITTDSEKRTLEGRSKVLLQKLQSAGVGSRPIIWVGHSMGGLLIKQMIKLAEQDPTYKHIYNNTSGLLMYSVPHRGLPIVSRSSQAHYLFFPSTEVQELSQGSEQLHKLHEHFQKFVQSRNVPLLSFGELEKTKISNTLPRLFLVPPESSDPGVGEFYTMPLNHINICKPNSPDSDLYQQSLAFIQRCIFLSLIHRFRQGVTGSGENS